MDLQPSPNILSNLIYAHIPDSKTVKKDSRLAMWQSKIKNQNDKYLFSINIRGHRLIICGMPQ